MPPQVHLCRILRIRQTGFNLHIPYHLFVLAISHQLYHLSAHEQNLLVKHLHILHQHGHHHHLVSLVCLYGICLSHEATFLLAVSGGPKSIDAHIYSNPGPGSKTPTSGLDSLEKV